MNYIAHIHQAHITQTSLLGNFLGDFVKGKDLSAYSAELQLGISLHRNIDTYTDNHPLIQELRLLFPKTLRRMSGVIIDIYFDHLLCKHFNVYSEGSISVLLNGFYVEMEKHDVPLQGRYRRVRDGLLQYKWLADYERKEACVRAYQQIEKRLNYKLFFADEAAQFIASQHHQLYACFVKFYPQLLAFSLNRVSTLRGD